MAQYSETSTVGQIMEDHPETEELFTTAARVQLERFKHQELAVAAPYLGLTKEKIQALLSQVNK